MSEEKQPISINKQLRDNYKKYFVEKSGLVSFLALAIFLSLALGYIIPITLLVTIPILVAPMLFGFILENSTVNIGMGKVSRIFKGYSLYYSNLFFGCFRILEGILKTILTYLIATTIFSIIFHFAIGLIDVSYVELFSRFDSITKTEELQRFLLDLQENSAFILISNLTEVVSFGLASYMLVHHVLTHSFKLFFSLSDKHLIPMNHVYALHRDSFRKFRKDFYFQYYSSFWFMILLFVGGYVGGAILGINVLGRSGLEAGIIGLALGTILSIYFLPYLYDTYQILFTLLNRFYYESFLNLDGTMKLSNKKYLKEEERVVLKTMVDEANRMFEEAKNNKKKKV